jgi:glycogen phosphorylase
MFPLMHVKSALYAAAFLSSQEQVSAAFKDQDTWTRKSILNVARMGRFSGDRTVREYADEIWGAKPVAEGSRANREN